jgi:hypothetical protein
MVLAQLAQDAQGGGDRGVVLHVEGDRGVRGGLADPTGVLERQGLVEGLAQRGELDRDLGTRRQVLEDQLVRLDGGLCLFGVEGVLAEVVEGHQETVVDEPAGDRQRLIGGLPRDEPADHPPGHRRGLDRLPYGPAACGGEQCSAKHGTRLSLVRPFAREAHGMEHLVGFNYEIEPP